MKEFVKSEQFTDTYFLLTRHPSGYIVDHYHPVIQLPEDAKVVGTCNVWESGYDSNTGETYEEAFVEFYENT